MCIDVNDDRVVPARHPAHAEIEQDQHRPTGRKFIAYRRQSGRQYIRQAFRSAGRREQLALQAALPLRQVDLAGHLVQRRLNTTGYQDRRERRRAALESQLWKKGCVDQFPGVGGRSIVAQLRRHGAATGDNQEGRHCEDPPGLIHQPHGCCRLYIFLKMSVTPTSSRISSTRNTTPITEIASPPATCLSSLPSRTSSSASVMLSTRD